MDNGVPTEPFQPKRIQRFPELPNGSKRIIPTENEPSLTLKDVEALLSDYKRLAHPDPLILLDDLLIQETQRR